MTEKFQAEGIDLIVLAGWLLIIPQSFVGSFEDKINFDNVSYFPIVIMVLMIIIGIIAYLGRHKYNYLIISTLSCSYHEKIHFSFAFCFPHNLSHRFTA